MALAKDSPQTTVTAISVPVRGANRLKLPAMAASHTISTTMKGMGMVPGHRQLSARSGHNNCLLNHLVCAEEAATAGS